MPDTADTYANLLTRLGDTDDGSGTNGVGWIAPEDMRALLRSVAAASATVSLASGGALPDAAGAVVPPASATVTPGFSAGTGNNWFGVPSGQPTRVGTLSFTATFVGTAVNKGTLTVKVGAADVLKFDLTKLTATGGEVSGTAAGVLFTASENVTVEITGIWNDAAATMGVRMGANASLVSSGS